MVRCYVSQVRIARILAQCIRGGKKHHRIGSVFHENVRECPLFNCIHSALIDIKNIHQYLLKIPNHLILHPQSCLSIIAAFSLSGGHYSEALLWLFIMRFASLCRHNIKGKHQWISWVSYFNLFYVNHDIFFKDREKL